MLTVKAGLVPAQRPCAIYEESFRFSWRPQHTAARRPAESGRSSRTAGSWQTEIFQKRQSPAASLSLLCLRTQSGAYLSELRVLSSHIWRRLLPGGAKCENWNHIPHTPSLRSVLPTLSIL